MITSLLDCFEKTVTRKPEKIAVRHRDQTISFAELKQKAQYFGNGLVKKYGCDDKRPLAVFLPKEIHTVVADLSIMYACRPFMNLDVKTPMERIANIIKLVQPIAVITSAKYIPLFAEVDIDVIDMDNYTYREQGDIQQLAIMRKQWIDTDPLCIINTSGSTGTPKGVVLNTRSFLDFIRWADERFHFDSSEIMGSLSPVVFDIFDYELVMLMVHGTQLVLLDPMLASFPAKLLQVMQETKVNFIFWVPSIMVNIANMGLLDKLPLPELRMVWFAGEVFPTKQFNVWYDHLPQATFVNLYGPIEITLDCIFHVVTERPQENEPLPIGLPCHNTDILLLDEVDQLCQTGQAGEICVRGTSLAMGYYNNPEKTQAAFTQNPLQHAYPEYIYRTGDIAYRDEKGLYHFKGRKDSLIKHMGYRIELGEIEHVLENDLKLVKYCCAVYQYARKEIMLFYQGEQAAEGKEFRQKLMQEFPNYMIPKAFIHLTELPRNTNGKIDRLLLKNIVNECKTIEEGLQANGLKKV